MDFYYRAKVGPSECADHVLGKKITKIPLVTQLVKALIFTQKNCRSAIGQKRYCNSLSPGIV